MSDVSLSQTMIFGHLWQSVAIAAVLAGVLILGKRMRGETRYGLAAGAFVASLALPMAAFIPGETIVAGLLKQMNAPVSLASAAPVAALPALPAPAPVAAPAPAVDPSVRHAVFEAVAPAALAAPAAPAAPVVVNAAAPAPMLTLPEIKLPELGLPLLAIWLAGVGFLLVRTGRDLIAVERLVARAKPAVLPDALKARMAGVRVLVSPEAPGPMAAGLFKPAIVLPESIALGSPGMAALLEHEHAHIRRRDMLTALGQRIVLALMWWSPALYWMSRRMDEEREVACDEAAVDRTGDAKAFARSLTKQAENQLWVSAPRLAVGAIGPRSQFGRRIKRLIDIAKTGGHPARYSGRLAFAGLALAVAVAAMITPRFTAEAQPRDERNEVNVVAPKNARQAFIDEQRSTQLDGAPKNAQFEWQGDDFAGFGDEINQLVQSMMPELERSLADLSPELQAEMASLSVELASLGAEISAQVNSEMMREMPAVMEEVRAALLEAGLDPDNMDQWQNTHGFNSEELRQQLREAEAEMKAALGPELKEEIRRAMEQAREEIAAHKEEIADAMRERNEGLAIAREAMAQARAEIAAARARGDFDKMSKISFNRGPGNPLYDAADDCDLETTRQLIKDKADVNAMWPGRGTALMAAADNNCPGVAQELIRAGADVNIGFPGKGTPLSIAADNHATAVAQVLLKNGADANLAITGKDTPLITAVREGDLEIVKLLVKNGADVNALSMLGRGTALKQAERNDEEEIAAYLRSQGAVSDLRKPN